MKFLRHLPNAITLSNLALGVLSIIASTQHELLWAATFIALATVPDFLDGLVARLLKVSSAVGRDLDSLADMVTFTVAPAIMLFRLQEQYFDSWTTFLVVLVPLAGALRLAIFNNDERQTTDFYGLTTTASALWLSTWPFLIEFEQIIPTHVFTNPYTFAIALVVIPVLMLANIRLFSLKIKSLKWAENRLQYSLLVLSVGYLALFGFFGVTLIIITYIILSLIRNFAA